MIKSYIITSERKIDVEDEQMQITKVTSEFSATKEYLLNFEKALKKVLSEKFKKNDYKILIVSDENKAFKGIKVLELVILLNNKKRIDFVKEQLTRIENYSGIINKIKFGILNETQLYDDLKSTSEINAQSWADEIFKYLANNFNFNGKINIEVSSYEQEIQSFWATASGKGVDDDIVWALKEMSNAITLSKNFGFYINDKYSFIDGYFQR